MAPLERAIDVVESNWPWALAALMLLDVALLLYMGRGLSFFFDDWDYVTHDYGGGIHSLLLAHNGHMSLFPVAVYKVLFHLVGLNHYAVFRLVLIALHLLCAGLVFVLASRRVSRVPALLATALVLFLGVAWEDLLWAFQISYLLSVAGGLAAWTLLERRDRLGNIGAMLAVVVSLGSSGLGIPVLIGVTGELGWRREWRRWFIVVVPAVFYGLWYLHYGENEITKSGLINSPGFAEDIAAAAFGGVAGRGLDWGRPIAFIGLLALLRTLARSVPISARMVGLLTTGISLWMLTAVARSTISTPETGRYVYLGAIIIVLVCIELMQGITLSQRAIALGAVVVALCVITGLTDLHNGALELRGTSQAVTAELGALELASAQAPPGFQLDSQRAPQILAGLYLHTVRAIGSSPADSPAKIEVADPISRDAADSVLVALEPPFLTPLGSTRRSPLAPAPGIISIVSGTLLQHGGCVELKPLPGGVLTGILSLPVGGVAIYNRGAQSVSAEIRRFGEVFHPISGTAMAHSAVVLHMRQDAASLPWQLQLSSSSPLSVCGLSA